MTPDTDPRTVARTRAQAHFAAAEQRDATVFAEIARERTATENKTAKLRALRLAKEEDDRKGAEGSASAAPAPRQRRRKSAKRAIRVSVPA